MSGSPDHPAKTLGALGLRSALLIVAGTNWNRVRVNSGSCKVGMVSFVARTPRFRSGQVNAKNKRQQRWCPGKEPATASMVEHLLVEDRPRGAGAPSHPGTAKFIRCRGAGTSGQAEFV